MQGEGLMESKAAVVAPPQRLAEEQSDARRAEGPQAWLVESR